jgi:hypothetical protein
MVKSSRKVSKFIIDIDKVVKKKDAKIKKQKGIIKALKSDPKIKKHKVTILSLQSRLAEVENELRRYKVGRVTITNKTVENAFKNLRNGQSLFKMKAQTKRLIEMSGRWDEARKIHTQKLLC